MQHDYTIVLLDDDVTRREKVHTILEFMGERCVIANTDSYAQLVAQQATTLYTIVGASRNLAINIECITKATPATPIIILETDIATTINQAQLQHVIGHLRMPFSYAAILEVLHKCRIHCEQHAQSQGQQKTKAHPLIHSLVGTSSGITAVRRMIEQVSDSDASVLILGESGVGKEVVARNIHNLSNRKDKPFVPINCGAIPPDLLESELFGHEKGAFTGAIAARKGRFELAEGGTLFLDEIGDMPLAMQVKLLRVLQERCFERVGSNKSITIDVRIIAATHRDLEQEIIRGNFREDLFYRLNVFPIQMPALRERAEDMPQLINEIVARMESEKRDVVRFLPDAIKAMHNYPWPGNVRELANLIERLAILHPGGIVSQHDLPEKFQQQQANRPLPHPMPEIIEQPLYEQMPEITSLTPALPNQGIDLKEHLVKTELAIIEQALAENDWIVAHAAKYLNMRRTTLVEKMRKYHINRPGMAAGDDLFID